MQEENARIARKNPRKPSMPVKMGMTLFVGLSLTFTTAYADDNETVKDIYHVYVNGKHAGTIDDKAVVRNMMETRVEEKEESYDDLSITIGEDVSFVQEQVFKPEYNNDKVSQQLKSNLSIKAEAVELKIGGESVGFFKDRETAEDVLQTYKANYIDKDVLDKLSPKEKNSDSDYKRQALVNDKQNNQSLQTGDTVVTDVTLPKDVSFSEQKVVPSDVLTEKQGLKKLEKGTLEDKTHVVKEGEVLSEVADEYDLTVDKIVDLNQDLEKDSILQVGQEIHVTDYKPFVDVIVKQEELKNKSIDYGTKVIKSDDLYKGDEKVKQEGQKGKKEVRYAIEKTNGRITTKEVLNDRTIKEPVRKVIKKGTKVVSSRGTGNLHWPTVGGYVSSNMGGRWGSMHKGMDIAQPSNRSILAADNGTVVSAGYDDGGYGNKIVISHNNGMKTMYAHLSSISVSSGQTVEKGSKIGVMGATGNSTGVHLHFELYKNGALQNPQDYLQ